MAQGMTKEEFIKEAKGYFETYYRGMRGILAEKNLEEKLDNLLDRFIMR